MSLRSSGFLGLAVGQRSITCTELSVHGDRRTIRRTAVFSLPTELSFDQPDAAGQKLAHFLRQHRFRASRAVVGVPARWLIAVERELPPTDPEQALSILRLHAERLSASESGEIIFDYAGQPEATGQSRVLLVGILRQRLENLEALLDAAGITASAVTSASLALAGAVERDSDQPMIVLAPQEVEVVWQYDGSARLLRHMAAPPNGDGLPAIGPLSSELRRAVVLAPTQGGRTIRELLLWDGVGLSDRQVSELTDRLGVPIRSGSNLPALGVDPNGASPAAAAGQFAPATALALTAAKKQLLPIDFKHSRLARPREKRLDRRLAWAVVLGAVTLLAVASLYWNVQSRRSELTSLQTQVDDLAGDVKSAEQMLDRVKYARGFFDSRTPTLECLREITLSFRDDEPIWVTGFTLRESGKGTIVGKATDQKLILTLCDRLQKNPRFSDVHTMSMQMVEVNAAGGRSREQTFTIAFIFAGTE